MSDAAATGGTKGNRYSIGNNGLSCAFTEQNSQKRLKAMIIGIDIRDSAANAMRVLPASPYCLLDGTQNTFSFEADADIDNEYYTAITRFDQVHKSFCGFLSGISDIGISPDIYKLYSAYNYIFYTDDSAWVCENLVEYLELLLEKDHNLSANNMLSKKLVSNIGRLMQRDEASGYRLIDCMYKMGEANEEELCGIALNAFTGKLAKGSPSLMQSFENLKKQPFAPIAIKKLVNEQYAVQYGKILDTANPDTIEQILFIYSSCLQTLKQPGDENWNKLLISALNQGIKLKNNKISKHIIETYIDTIAKAIKLILPLGEKYRTDANTSSFFWGCVTDVYTDKFSIKDIDVFCHSLFEKGFTGRVEYILIVKMQQGTKTDDLYAIFHALYKNPLPYPHGRAFFKEYINRSDISHYSTILDRLETSNLNEKAKLELYELIDKKLPLIIKPRSPEDAVERKLMSLASGETNYSRSACGVLLANLQQYSGQPDKLTAILKENMGSKISVDLDFTETIYCKTLIDKIVPAIKTDAQHAMLLSVFKFPGNAFEEYAKKYLDKITDIVSKSPANFISILQLLAYNPQLDNDELMNQICSAIGETYFLSLQTKIRAQLPISYSKVFSNKLNENLQMLTDKQPGLKKIFSNMLVIARKEYENNGSLLKKLGNFIFGN
ncbi:hypothetical protein [Leadbettera azotonutricia]|nr:hypothetical protein [Leadbettera azotonutricia]